MIFPCPISRFDSYIVYKGNESPRFYHVFLYGDMLYNSHCRWTDNLK